MPSEKPRKQVVYGLWVIEYQEYQENGRPFGRWLEWHDVRLEGVDWGPHLKPDWNHGVYIFSSRKAELVNVLKYMRGEGLPDHVKRSEEETCLANYIYPDNTKAVVIRKVQLPAPIDAGVA